MAALGAPTYEAGFDYCLFVTTPLARRIPCASGVARKARNARPAAGLGAAAIRAEEYKV
jgi:hypothetical protein